MACKIRCILIVIALAPIFGCSPEDFGEVDISPPKPVTHPRGLFVINEGLFNQGNGEITYINESTGEIVNSFFTSVNGYSPGDILMDAIVVDDDIYLSVNNSNLVYVLDNSWKVKSKIKIIQPRYLLAGKSYVYVSSLYRPYIYLINREQLKLVDSIPVHRPLEQIMWVNGKLWGVHWSTLASQLPNRFVMIVDTVAKALVDSIEVGKEPNSMVMDATGHVWVLCSGGYLQEEAPSLWRINSQSFQAQKILQFMQGDDYPTSLCINFTGDTLFWIDKNIYALPTQNIIPQLIFQNGNDAYYNICPDSIHKTLWVCNAKDYLHQGDIIEIKTNGQIIKKYPVDIIPRKILFFM